MGLDTPSPSERVAALKAVNRGAYADAVERERIIRFDDADAVDRILARMDVLRAELEVLPKDAPWVEWLSLRRKVVYNEKQLVKALRHQGRM